MLHLDQPLQTVDGVTLARDDQDPHARIVLPPPPRVARVDGVAQVELLRFVERGALTGGHLQIAVELGHPEGLLEAVQRSLRESERDDRITLTPALVLRATAEVFFAGREVDDTGGETPLFRRVYAETVPALDPPHAARFAATLTADGVRAMEAALRARGAPVGVAYRLQVEGIRAGQRVVARVDWGRAYEQLSTHARRGCLVVVDDLFKLSERLVQDKVIAIDVVRGLADEGDVGPVEDATATALNWIQRMLIERFCEPVLPLDREPARASLGALGELAGVGAAFEVRELAQVERGVATVDLQRPEVVVRTLTAQAHLGDLLGASPPDAHISDAGLDHPFFQRVSLHLSAARPLRASGVREVVGDWSYGATRAALRLTPEQPDDRVSAWADASADRSWTLQLDVTLADDAPVDAGERVQLAPRAGRGGELTLDLDALLGRRRVEVAMTPDRDRVRATRVKLRHGRGDETVADEEVTLTPDAPQGAQWLRDWRQGDSLVATVEHLLASGQRLAVKPVEVETTVFRVPPAFPGSMTVDLFAEDDWTDLDRVVVQVQKREDLPVGTFTFTQGGASAAVRLDMPDPADRRFRYHTVRLWSDGRSDEDDWVETDVPAVLVGRVAANLLVVELTPLGPELPTAGVLLIEVDLVYVDVANELRAQHTALIRARADRPRWEVSLRDPLARSYDYRVTVHRTSGEKKVGPWTRSSARILPVPVTST